MKHIKKENKEFDSAPKFEISRLDSQGKEVKEVATDYVHRDKTGTVHMLVEDKGLKMLPNQLYRIRCAELKIDMYFKSLDMPRKPIPPITRDRIILQGKFVCDLDILLECWDSSPQAWYLFGVHFWARGKEPR